MHFGFGLRVGNQAVECGEILAFHRKFHRFLPAGQDAFVVAVFVGWDSGAAELRGFEDFAFGTAGKRPEFGSKGAVYRRTVAAFGTDDEGGGHGVARHGGGNAFVKFDDVVVQRFGTGGGTGQHQAQE